MVIVVRIVIIDRNAPTIIAIVHWLVLTRRGEGLKWRSESSIILFCASWVIDFQINEFQKMIILPSCLLTNFSPREDEQPCTWLFKKSRMKNDTNWCLSQSIQSKSHQLSSIQYQYGLSENCADFPKILLTAASPIGIFEFVPSINHLPRAN